MFKYILIILCIACEECPKTICIDSHVMLMPAGKGIAPITVCDKEEPNPNYEQCIKEQSNKSYWYEGN